MILQTVFLYKPGKRLADLYSLLPPSEHWNRKTVRESNSRITLRRGFQTALCIPWITQQHHGGPSQTDALICDTTTRVSNLHRGSTNHSHTWADTKCLMLMTCNMNQQECEGPLCAEGHTVVVDTILTLGSIYASQGMLHVTAV